MKAIPRLVTLESDVYPLIFSSAFPSVLSRASLVAQLVKNPPAMQETWVRSLGWEDPLEKGKASFYPLALNLSQHQGLFK